jgi:hypothetical protein
VRKIPVITYFTSHSQLFTFIKESLLIPLCDVFLQILDVPSSNYGYGMDDRIMSAQFPAEARNFSLLKTVPTVSAAHPAPSSISIWCFFYGGTAFGE